MNTVSRTYWNFILFMALVLLLPGEVFAQRGGKIQEIVVETNVKGTEEVVVKMCGLEVGSMLSNENIANSIATLWDVGIFSDIRISQERVEGGYKVIITVKVLPTINSFEITGTKEFKKEEIITATGIAKGMAIGAPKLDRFRRKILGLYKEKGFHVAKVAFDMKPLSSDSTKVDLTVAVHEGKKVKVRSINIVGNDAMSEKKIKKTIKSTKEDRWYRSGDFNEEKFEEDKKLIQHLYKSEGYRDAQVLPDSIYFDEKSSKYDITLFISEGPKYKFGKTTVEGNTRFTDEQLLEKIRYKEGDIFNEDELLLSVHGYSQQAIIGITTIYNDEGYLKTFVEPVQSVRGDSIDIHVQIAEGNISNVSKVIVEGNTKTIEKVIRREVSLDPGMPFSRSKLERSQRDIMALNYFQKVEPDYEPNPDSDDVDIKFKVTEKQTGIASLGAGYSERDKLVGTLSFANQNLFGNGQSINFNWDMGSRRKAFQIGLGEPWLFNTPTSFSFDIYNIVRSDYTSAFDQEKRKGATIRIGRRLDKWIDFSRVYVSYRLEDVDYSNPEPYYQYYLITGKTSSLSFNFIRDSRDLPQFASKGGRTSAIFELAGGPLGGDLSYCKYLLNNEVYVPVFTKFSLVLRTNIGFLKGYKENTFVPYSERFMPGGTSWDGFVRGYSNRQVSPRLRGEEVGGETMLVNNIEFQIPIVAQTLYGIVFYDFGNAWRNLSETNPFDVKRSVGVGARVYIPGIGLVGFDFGYGMDKLEGSDKVSGWRTHFQFGTMW